MLQELGMSDPATQLYLITPPTISDLAAFGDQLASAIDAGNVACVQLRLKDVDDDTVKRAAETLGPIVQNRDVAFLMNDRADLAVECGCDGVHIGQEDGTYEEARQLIGREGIVGVTCHNSKQLAFEAGDKGADYVAFGAFFPTGTKEPKTEATFELINAWTMMTTVPCVAIGGITPENCEPLVTVGADFLAVVGGVWNHPDGPAAAVKAFNEVIERVNGSSVA